MKDAIAILCIAIATAVALLCAAQTGGRRRHGPSTPGRSPPSRTSPEEMSGGLRISGCGGLSERRVKRALQILVAIVMAPLATVGLAQPSEWTITPYAWVAGFDGTVGVAGTGSGLIGRVDVNTSDLSENLRVGGAMLHMNWRSGRWTGFGDWTYANVKADTPTPFTTLYAGVDVKLKGNIVQAFGGYELLGARDSHLDVFGGIRYYDLEVGLGLREGTLPGVLLTEEQNWADGVVGVRWDTRFAGNWQAFASADVGTGGSNLSWQLFGGVGHRFSWGSVVGGWRHLHIDYEKSSFLLDAALSGPFIGASFQF